MQSYRIYHVGPGGRLRVGDTIHAAGDDDAVIKAHPLLSPGEAAELWQGGRLVGRFSRTREFAPGS
ncbi:MULTISPECIES: hypothetical protein [unclassified Phenylobacterium]|uniref:hypothetical protein n=1 Tax=unclassified Phenylobacterium TaxID=2640670 RepID=UPI0012E7EA02|nr:MULTISPECIES: hypothetical protein [unclassified Phenylobacterium]